MPTRSPRPRPRTAVTLSALAAGTALLCLPSAATAAPALPRGTAPAADAPALFDDFAYTDSADPALADHGWSVRGGSGGPGVPGAVWDPAQVTFRTAEGSSVLDLETSTAGTPESTRQTEILTRSQKFQNGTYAARVHFSDAPESGPDGDRVVQTFFTINDLKAPMADDYAEYDFEYLPNGGWGEPSSTLFTTSWETYNPEPWEAVNQHSESRTSFAGWHDLVMTIDGGAITYWIDGSVFATHDAAYLPERPMSINFNQWLIDLEGQPDTGPRSYHQQVDYVLHVKDENLTPDQVGAEVEAYRAAGTSFVDEVPAP
ncbi:putative hydrolase (putative secreted protein) [Streptomyces albus]|uniref:Putative hydrolase (Putative secreted protein) n=1 Tax=Streptomyces albus (strain ATCC 21838 / DSM 41398 / FERM P-419 / JCM 4703 / NBRC 107858) TaxID=1081613 RepID=A0A0B5EF42_STRA4|nr:putative hydrolase (putative secreted protein) [Streptomyces albus]AOU74931.1 putative hydrolase (putative secreted protein) [Streptomyces albus]